MNFQKAQLTFHRAKQLRYGSKSDSFLGDGHEVQHVYSSGYIICYVETTLTSNL